ncbi:MAG: hybrid sensor histidine kinase/response regulator [Deltaproteobacteria bacterium]|nr:hybrid sensor histidine kinase/response regulator [Deltaproteobacteria bacterium]
MLPRSSTQRVLELVDRQLSGTLAPAAEAELAQALAALDSGTRALAERLVGLGRERREFRRGLVQTAKLAEVGMAFAELVHELRQPLSSISGFAQLLSPASKHEELADGLREILHQCGRMETMLEGLRRFLRAGDDPDGQAATKVRELDVEEALRASVALAPKMPPGVQLEVQISPDLGKVVSEAQPFSQVILNLLANARDAQAAKGPGTVLLMAEREGDGVSVVIADEGTGIAPEFTGRLFEPFATTKGEAGTGLGLYICQELLATWGAEITLLSPPPRPYVTAFAVRLRSARASTTPVGRQDGLDGLRTQLAERVVALKASQSVLVVDDEPGVRRVLRVLVSADEGLEVTEAGDGHEALELLQRSPVQVLIADNGLPGMTGLEVVRQAIAGGRAAEAIALTSLPSPETVVEALNAGACGYLLKPVEDAQALRSCLRGALARDRMRQLVAALGSDLRPWADRALAAAREARASRALIEALEILARRLEGPARVGVVAEKALISPLALAGHRAEGPWELPRALSAAAAGEIEALVLGEGPEAADAAAFARMVLDGPWPPALIWALEPGGFDQTLALLEAQVAAVVRRPVDLPALAAAVSRAVERRRRELKARALGLVLEQLQIPMTTPTASKVG